MASPGDWIPGLILVDFEEGIQDTDWYIAIEFLYWVIENMAFFKHLCWAFSDEFRFLLEEQTSSDTLAKLINLHDLQRPSLVWEKFERVLKNNNKSLCLLHVDRGVESALKIFLKPQNKKLKISRKSDENVEYFAIRQKFRCYGALAAAENRSTVVTVFQKWFVIGQALPE